MSTKLKRVIINKILNNSVDKNTLHSTNYFKLVHKYSDKSFIINFSKESSGTKRLNTPDNQQYSHSFKVDRDIFIKEIVNNLNFMKDENQIDAKRKKIVIDFSSPNIAKPFHAGHLRSTIIGNFIGNINSYFHNDVVKINYLGDWGTQFGLLQYGLNKNNISLEKLQSNPIKQLYEIYVETNKLSVNNEKIQQEARDYFSNIEQGMTDLQNWETIRKITVDELQKVYQRLGIQFDSYHWESDYNANAIKDIIKLLEDKNIIFNDDENKKVAKFRGKNVTVLKSDKSTLYLSRDIAALLDRYKKYKFDKMLYVVDNAQTDHFAAVFDIVGQVNKDCAGACEHVKFGRLKGMSTRTGNVIFLNDILDESKRKMQEKQQKSKNTRDSAMNEETCDVLGITAVIINDLKQKRQRDYVFDWDKALQSEGDSGIKLQYLHCRLMSLEKNCGVEIPSFCAPEYLKEEVVGDVVGELARFDDILYRAYAQREACIIVNYLFRLAKHVNRMFNELNVKNETNDVAAQRLLIFHSSRKVLKKSLEILGIRPLNEM